MTLERRQLREVFYEDSALSPWLELVGDDRIDNRATISRGVLALTWWRAFHDLGRTCDGWCIDSMWGHRNTILSFDEKDVVGLICF